MPIGIPAAIMAASAIGGGASILGGALSSRQKQQTSTTTPQWSPEQQQLLSQLQNYSTGLMNNPGAGLQPIRTASTDRINRRYAAMPGKISQNLASRGYGSSGNFGNSMFQTEFARSGELSDLDSMMAQMLLGRQDEGANLAGQILNTTKGSTTTGTIPGDVAGSAFQSVGNGLGNLAQLMMLSKVLKGGGLGITTPGHD